MNKNKIPKKILICRTDRLGDVILSTPVIKNLRQSFPQSHIAFLVRPYTKEVLQGNPFLDEVIVCDKYGKQRGLIPFLRFVKRIRAKQFDWAIVLHPTNRMHLLSFLSGIKVRIGWDKKLGFLLNQRYQPIKHQGQRHELEYNLDILRYLGLKNLSRELYFPIKKQAMQQLEQTLKSHGVKPDDSLLVIHPLASCPSKHWPPEYFNKLISLIKERYDYKIIVVGQENNKTINYITRGHSVVNLAAKLSIAELGCLLHKSRLFISNDSGPVHIAAALDTPVISIFGRGDKGLSPQRWRPLAEHSFYLHKDVGCRQCLAHNCQRDFLCLRSIKPEEVFELMQQILQEKGGAKK